MKQRIALLFLMASASVLAQNQKVGNSVFSFAVSGAKLNVQKFPVGKDLDFLNYIDSETAYFVDYEIVKIGYKFTLNPKTSMDIRVLIMSDLLPDNFDIAVYHHMNGFLSVGAGAMLYKNYISYFEQFLIDNNPDYFLVDENEKQWKQYDLGFYLTPVFMPINTENFRATFKMDVGLSSFLREAAVFYLKKKLSNERQLHHYATKLAFQPYINPKLDASLVVVKVNKAAIGVMAGANFFYAKRRVNYERAIQTWTMDNEVSDLVKTPKHAFSRFEMDLGLFVKW
jgi:hypothetical protein